MMIMNRIGVEGSNIGGSVDMAEMLNFSALHKVAPKVEVLPFSQVNQALDKVRNGTARYRMVVTNAN
jgi:D-arabinose 1-dehydrogenase-like Zn-dependent alcohol dehydrogenase